MPSLKRSSGPWIGVENCAVPSGVRDCTDYRERMLGTGREFQGVNGCLIFNFYMVIIKDVQLVRVGIK